MEIRKIELIEQSIKENAPLLIGELLSNLEALKDESLSFEQIKSIFKSLLKEKVYQNSRNLNKLIRAILVESQIIFRRPKKQL